MLQDEQTVSFEGMSFEVFHPWYVRLFGLYLFVVIVLAVLRMAQLLWSLRKRRVAQQSESSVGLNLSDFWELSYVKAKSFKTLSYLTLLIAVIVLTWNFSDALAQVATQKPSGIGAVAGAFGEALKSFSAGIIVSATLFCCAAFCERLIHRHRLGITRKRSRSDDAVE